LSFHFLHVFGNISHYGWGKETKALVSLMIY